MTSQPSCQCPSPKVGQQDGCVSQGSIYACLALLCFNVNVHRRWQGLCIRVAKSSQSGVEYYKSFLLVHPWGQPSLKANSDFSRKSNFGGSVESEISFQDLGRKLVPQRGGGWHLKGQLPEIRWDEKVLFSHPDIADLRFLGTLIWMS